MQGPGPPELSVRLPGDGTPWRWAGLRLLTSRRPLSWEPQHPRTSWQVTAEGARGSNVVINQVSDVWLANISSHSIGCLSSLLLTLMRRSRMPPHLSTLPLLCRGDGRKQRARHPTAGSLQRQGYSHITCESPQTDVSWRERVCSRAWAPKASLLESRFPHLKNRGDSHSYPLGLL